jgi:hypothetical protein
MAAAIADDILGKWAPGDTAARGKKANGGDAVTTAPGASR